MPRLINCKGCGNHHTGSGGSRCKFVLSYTLPKVNLDMAAAEENIPSRDSPEYTLYLEQKIAEQEELLEQAEEDAKVSDMEKKLADLKLRTRKLASRDTGGGEPARTVGFAGRALLSYATLAKDPQSTSPAEQQYSKSERDIISKLHPCSYVPDFKSVEKTRYRDFIAGMCKVLQFVNEVNGTAKGYASHMAFIAKKASLNIYATDALIRYDMGVTDKVIFGELDDWVPADLESVAMNLGADATYAVRGSTQSSWPRAGSGISRNSRDFSDWPKDICWLYDNTSCYFPKCCWSHICSKCQKSGHCRKDCENSEKPAMSPPVDERRPKTNQNRAPKK